MKKASNYWPLLTQSSEINPPWNPISKLKAFLTHPRTPRRQQLCRDFEIAQVFHVKIKNYADALRDSEARASNEINLNSMASGSLEDV